MLIEQIFRHIGWDYYSVSIYFQPHLLGKGIWQIAINSRANGTRDKFI